MDFPSQVYNEKWKKTNKTHEVQNFMKPNLGMIMFQDKWTILCTKHSICLPFGHNGLVSTIAVQNILCFSAPIQNELGHI